jgi:hypothetical protein
MPIVQIQMHRVRWGLKNDPVNWIVFHSIYKISRLDHMVKAKIKLVRDEIAPVHESIQ